MGNIDSDPEFVDIPNGDFHLTSHSPCIDVGTDSGAPPDDIDGDVRPFDVPAQGADGTGTEFDIGADEYVGDSPPAQPSNVSPSDDEVDVELTPALTSSTFSDPNGGDTHAASHWQIRAAASSPGYSVTVHDSGETETDLTSHAVPGGRLNYNTAYAWRVKHKDNNELWSVWSDETGFTTEEGGVTNRPPDQPTNVEPAAGQTNVSLTPRLLGSPFVDPDAGDFQTGARWQIRFEPGTYDSPAYDSEVLNEAVIEHNVPSAYLAGRERYFWRMCYRDSRDMWSLWSVETRFRTRSTGALEVPEGLRAAAGAESVWLTWLLHRSHQIRGYNVYRSQIEDGPYIKINPALIHGAEFLDRGLAPRTHYYRITAVAANGDESVKTAPMDALVGATRIYMTNPRGEPGTTVFQMLTVNNPNAVENEGLDIRIRYDQTMLTPAAVNKTGLTQNFTVNDNVGTANGQLNIVGLGSGDVIQGEGHVFEVRYDVDPGAVFWTQSDLDFPFVELVATLDGEENPAPIPVDYTDTGEMTVAAPILMGDLSGNGFLSVYDAVLLRQVILWEITPTETQRGGRHQRRRAARLGRSRAPHAHDRASAPKRSDLLSRGPEA